MLCLACLHPHCIVTLKHLCIGLQHSLVVLIIDTDGGVFAFEFDRQQNVFVFIGNQCVFCCPLLLLFEADAKTVDVA